MKHLKRYSKIIGAIIFALIFQCMSVVVQSNKNAQAAMSLTAQNDKRACWISYLDIQTYLKDKSETGFRDKVEDMFQRVKDNQMDTVIVHARAMGDAMYPSAYFPLSVYISTGRKTLSYDPMKIMVEIAHEKGMKLEAWINPYRISLNNDTTTAFKATKYYEKYKSYIMEYVNAGQTCLALDPAKSSARTLIVNQIKELVGNYEVDGIHFDDYFYVSGMGPEVSLADRKTNVNKLVSAAYKAIKALNPKCVFGISPAGNIDNARAQGADVDTWMSKPGYVDYVMPQIYWTDNYVTSAGVTSMYTNRCTLWRNLNKLDIPIYVGLALYRVGEKSTIDCDWALRNDNMANQCKIAYEMGFDGYALFRYAWLEYSFASKELKNLKNYVQGVLPPTEDEGEEAELKDTYISYRGYVKKTGWQQRKADGIVAGSTAAGKQLEALRVELGGLCGSGGVTYRGFVQGTGWKSWVKDGKTIGKTGKRLEAVEIKLTGAAAKKYDVYYRANCEGHGWLGWAKNGEPAGTATYGKPMIAIQIRLVEKGNVGPSNKKQPYLSRLISYTAYLSGSEKTDAIYDGAKAGKTNNKKSLERIKISIKDKRISGGVRYRTYTQKKGWNAWVTDGKISGISKKPMEAIQIKLTGNLAKKYDITYRVYSEKTGWMKWVKNGTKAGITSKGKAILAIQIKLVPKK